MTPGAALHQAGFDFGLGTLPPIRGQGPADIIGFNERRAALVATHIPLIGVGVDQLSLPCHPFTFRSLYDRWAGLARPSERLNFLGLRGKPFIALSDDIAGLLWRVGLALRASSICRSMSASRGRPGGGWSIPKQHGMLVGVP
jgi:hypothetical protein